MEESDFKSKVKSFKECIVPAQSVLILTHDYPDPDCIASALGISHLCSFWGIHTSVISFGGFIGRAENRAMVRFLDITMVPFVLIDIKEFEKIVVVDSFPGKGNISLPPYAIVNAVIDHHPAPVDSKLNCFNDIRNDIGATSTLITKYLLEEECPIPSRIATALFYGIKTDTGDFRRDVSKYDRECYQRLFNMVDHRLLSYIEHPDRDIEFFRLLHDAVEATVIFKDVGYAHLGIVSSPDYIAEMADLIHSLEKIEWMICSGIFNNHIYFSIRSKNKNSAGYYAELIAGRLGGSGGGHGRAAAGRFQLSTGNAENNTLEQFEIIFKELFDIQNVQAVKLL